MKFNISKEKIIKIDVFQGSKGVEVLTIYDDQTKAAYDILVKTIEVTLEEPLKPILYEGQSINEIKSQVFSRSNNYKAVVKEVHLTEEIRGALGKLSQSRYEVNPNRVALIENDKTFDGSTEIFFITKQVKLLMEHSQLKLKLIEISQYCNKEYETEFFKRNQEGDVLTLLFHGSKSSLDLAQSYNLGMMKTGFAKELIGVTDDGYFGRGFYLTPDIDYALYYQLDASTIDELKEKIRAPPCTLR